MSHQIIKEEYLKYIAVEAKIEAGKLQAAVGVDLSGMLDDAAQKAKDAIPGDIDNALIDMFLAKLKETLLA